MEKVEIHAFSTGTTYTCEMKAGAMVKDCLKALGMKLGIDPTDLMLFHEEGICLDEDRPLDSYTINKKTNIKPKIFLLNQALFIKSNMRPPTLERLGPITTEKINPTARFCGPLETPHLSKILDCKHKSTYFLNKSNAIKQAVEERYRLIQEVIKRIFIQMEGCKAVHIFLCNYCKDVNDKWIKQFPYFKELDENCYNLLKKFETDLHLVKTMPDPVDQQKSLLNSLGPTSTEQRLKDWKSSCEKEHETFRSRLMELESLKYSLNNPEQLMNDPKLWNMENIPKDMMASQVENNKEVELIYQFLVANATKLDAILQKSKSSPSGIENLETELNQIYSSDSEKVKILDKIDEDTFDLLEKMEDKRQQLSYIFHMKIADIAKIEIQAKDFADKMDLLSRSLPILKKDFDQLAHLQNLPKAAQASKDELNRRIDLESKLCSEIYSLNYHYYTVVQQENLLRSQFLQNYGTSVPPNLAEQLNQTLTAIPFSLPENILIENVEPVKKWTIFSKAITQEEENPVDKAQYEAVLKQLSALQDALKLKESESLEQQSVQRELATAKTEITLGNALMKSVQDENLGLRMKLEELTKENGTLHLKVNEAVAQAISMVDNEWNLKKTASATAELEESRQSIEKLNAEIATLKDQLQAVTKECSAWKTDVDDIFKFIISRGSASPLSPQITTGYIPNMVRDVCAQHDRLCEDQLRFIESLQKSENEAQLKVISLLAKNEQLEREISRGKVCQNEETKKLQEDLQTFQTQLQLLKEQNVADDKRDKFAYYDFQVGDVCMWTPNDRKKYMAYNKDCPNYFIDTSFEYPQEFCENMRRELVIIGRIVWMEPAIALQGDDPYEVGANKEYGTGIPYFKCIIEGINGDDR